MRARRRFPRATQPTGNRRRGSLRGPQDLDWLRLGAALGSLLHLDLEFEVDGVGKVDERVPGWVLLGAAEESADGRWLAVDPASDLRLRQVLLSPSRLDCVEDVRDRVDLGELERVDPRELGILEVTGEIGLEDLACARGLSLRDRVSSLSAEPATIT